MIWKKIKKNKRLGRVFLLSCVNYAVILIRAIHDENRTNTDGLDGILPRRSEILRGRLLGTL